MIHVKNSERIIPFFYFKFPIWATSLSGDKELLQAPQKRRLKKLEGKLKQPSYPWRLSVPNCKFVVAGRRQQWWSMKDGGICHCNNKKSETDQCWLEWSWRWARRMDRITETLARGCHSQWQAIVRPRWENPRVKTQGAGIDMVADRCKSQHYLCQCKSQCGWGWHFDLSFSILGS